MAVFCEPLHVCSKSTNKIKNNTTICGRKPVLYPRFKNWRTCFWLKPGQHHHSIDSCMGVLSKCKDILVHMSNICQCPYMHARPEWRLLLRNEHLNSYFLFSTKKLLNWDLSASLVCSEVSECITLCKFSLVDNGSVPRTQEGRRHLKKKSKWTRDITQPRISTRIQTSRA